jgi:exopolyphosphatase / guanosine-5'-triphosphate,3'-diphosphate pyrophosphatase
MSRTKLPDVIAAVDLGSNSFHMVVARQAHGQLTIIDRLREPVRLASGLDQYGRLSREAMERALACLERFGQRLRDIQAESVRVVGTNTFRAARRKGAFLDRAREALGHPIEIIAGIEEARLIYLGVTQNSPSEPGKRLVVDIGGGSTEFIIGEGSRTLELESLHMGCVVMTQQYFADGELTDKRFKKARMAARVEMEPIVARYKARGWDQALGSSGTIRALADVARSRGSVDGSISLPVLETAIAHCVRAGHISRLRLPGLDDDRLPVFAGGLVILAEVLHMLDIQTMRPADGALREGLLYDLLGRHADEDARVRTVRAMQARYHVDVTQAERVERTALALLNELQKVWALTDPLAEVMLSWAARLHEIGLDISHSHYHRHSAYLAQNSDMPGFPTDEQRLLATLIGTHRRKLNLDGLQDLVPPWHLHAEILIVLLRLAVLLNRGRSNAPLPAIKLDARVRALDVKFPYRWLDEHPLTQADLEQETEWLKAVGFKLRVE